jgi:hypothetical protein
VLSDFLEFAQHVAALAGFGKETERFWVDGAFADDLGLEVAGAVGKIHKTPDEVAVIVANLTNQQPAATFEVNSLRHNIQGTSFSIVSSSGHSGQGRTESMNGKLRGSITLSSYEVMAMVYQRHGQNS